MVGHLISFRRRHLGDVAAVRPLVHSLAISDSAARGRYNHTKRALNVWPQASASRNDGELIREERI